MPRPLGTGVRFVRIEAGDDAHRPRIFIGRALWQEIGSPARIAVRRADAGFTLLPAIDPLGYAVAAGASGMPRMTVGSPLLTQLHIAAGRYPAQVRDGAIIVAS